MQVKKRNASDPDKASWLDFVLHHHLSISKSGDYRNLMDIDIDEDQAVIPSERRKNKKITPSTLQGDATEISHRPRAPFSSINGMKSQNSRLLPSPLPFRPIFKVTRPLPCSLSGDDEFAWWRKKLVYVPMREIGFYTLITMHDAAMCSLVQLTLFMTDNISRSDGRWGCSILAELPDHAALLWSIWNWLRRLRHGFVPSG